MSKVRKYRKRLKMSIKELASKVDVSYLTISNIELGKNGMRFSTAVKIADVLKISLYDLIE